MNTATEKLLNFIEKSPTGFHAVAEAAEILEKNGYSPLNESDLWDLHAGGKYYVTRNQSSLIAFQLPDSCPHGFMICASHSDSPSFKIKENAENETAGLYVRLNTERYGGMLCSTWLDRPLSVAGRVVVQKDAQIHSVLVNIKRDLLLIPNVAIHMMRNANDGMSYNANIDMFPLYGDSSAANSFRSMIAAEAGCTEEQLLGTDLFLYNRMPGSVWGANEEFFSAPRLDDLQCVYASLSALTEATPHEAVPVFAVLDNEEVGSQTKQGANSTFLYDVLSRICERCSWNYHTMIAGSFCVSADNAHALHPNHPELSDSRHRPQMNGGVVIKHNANQKYTTDAVSQAIFRSVCQKADVPVQYFANRSDMPGGSTLGNISNVHVSLNTVDIGLSQLAMHSAYETAGVKDTEYLIRALRTFYSSALVSDADGVYTLLS